MPPIVRHIAVLLEAFSDHIKNDQVILQEIIKCRCDICVSIFCNFRKEQGAQTYTGNYRNIF